MLVGSILTELEKRIEICKKNKKEILEYIQRIKDKCLYREISYSEYEFLLKQKINGKTIEEWFNYYDSYIEICEKRIKNQERKLKTKKVFGIFLLLIFLSIIIFSAFYLRPVIIGLIVKEQVQEFTQQLNLEFNESTDYEWEIEHLGQLQSLKISGLAEGNGEVKIYLDNLLILDSS